MNRTLKIYIAILVLIIIGIIFVDANRPKPIDWTPTYATTDKIPLGLFVFNKEIDKLFPNEKIERYSTTLYEYLDPKFSYDDSTYSVKGNLLFINEGNSFDDASTDELLYFVKRGNTAFLSMKSFPERLMDSLNMDFENRYFFGDSVKVDLTDKTLMPKPLFLTKGISNTYFNTIDSSKTTILGKQHYENRDYVNFIRVPYQNGQIFLHTQPTAFTNYNLLHKSNHQYTEALLAYLPKGTVLWQAHNYQNETISQSPMRYILSQPALKWAWYLFLLGMLTFMIFNAKRRQRIIPEKVPLTNTTVDFTKTIGNLYLQEGNHHNIIDKKIIYFLEKVRNDYLIDTFNLDEVFVNRLHQKTGKDRNAIEHVVLLIKKHRNNLQSTENDVIEISKAIEKLNKNK
ncbi:DUF4350 domain-containing protein [Flavobacterium enshiense]|uniref:DUF4350 domain-containing protein n=1 Tax=Flavobacterium enshiense TaxID=1341165 RepID=UPI00345D090E